MGDVVKLRLAKEIVGHGETEEPAKLRGRDFEARDALDFPRQAVV